MYFKMRDLLLFILQSDKCIKEMHKLDAIKEDLKNNPKMAFSRYLPRMVKLD